MTGVPEAGSKAFGDGCPFAVFQGPEQGHAGGRILQAIDRLDRRSPALRIAAVQLLDLHFLDMRRVRQHHRAKIDGGAGRMDRAGKALLDQLRQEPAVVDMRMRQDDSVNRVRRERERAIVQFPLRLRSLEQAAVDENPPARRFDLIAGAGDAVGRAMEAQNRIRAATALHVAAT